VIHGCGLVPGPRPSHFETGIEVMDADRHSAQPRRQHRDQAPDDWRCGGRCNVDVGMQHQHVMWTDQCRRLPAEGESSSAPAHKCRKSGADYPDHPAPVHMWGPHQLGILGLTLDRADPGEDLDGHEALLPFSRVGGWPQDRPVGRLVSTPKARPPDRARMRLVDPRPPQ
jgi:hypothetical protein